MSIKTPTEEERNGTDAAERDVRALTQFLTVLDDTPRVDGADGLYEVVSESGSAYVVDLELGACECPDYEFRDVRCKHLRRTAYATGVKPVPADVEGVDPDLGRHVDGEPQVAATDGGQVVEAEAEADADDGECEECAALPGEWPCATCAIQDGAPIPEEI